MSLERDLAAGIDPLAWLALADLREERGQLAGADLWRRRAGCLRAVLDLRGIAGVLSGPRVYRFDLTPGWAVHAYLTDREVRATLLKSGTAPIPLRTIGRYHLPRASLLGQTQRSPKVAERYLRRKAFAWAEMLTPAVAKEG